MASTFRPITDDEMLVITERMLKKIKMICPRFSIPADPDEKDMLIGMWAKALRMYVEYPRSAYEMAIDLYAASASREDNAPLPGDILKYCREAVAKMEVDPQLAPRINDWRAGRREIMDRRVAPN